MSDILNEFKKRLADGAYKNLTGARRGIGKFKDMSDKERDEARALADKHFGDNPAPTAAGKKTKAPAQARVAKPKAAVKKVSDDTVKAPVTAKSRQPRAALQTSVAGTEDEEIRRANQIIDAMGETIEHAKAAASVNMLADTSTVLAQALKGIEAAQRMVCKVAGVSFDELPPESQQPDEPALSDHSNNGASTRVSAPTLAQPTLSAPPAE